MYRGHGFDLAGARLILKLPLDVARRDATPSMDLDDYLGIVDDAALTILSRRPGGYDERTISHGAVCAIDDETDLLDGWITVYSAAGGAQGRAARAARRAPRRGRVR